MFLQAGIWSISKKSSSACTVLPIFLSGPVTGENVDGTKANGEKGTGVCKPATWAQGHWQRKGAKVTVQEDIVACFFKRTESAGSLIYGVPATCGAGAASGSGLRGIILRKMDSTCSEPHVASGFLKNIKNRGDRRILVEVGNKFRSIYCYSM